MQLYGILTGFYWLVVVAGNVVVLLLPFLLRQGFFRFDRPSAAFMAAFDRRQMRVIRAEALACLALQTTLVATLEVPLWRYAVVYLGFGFSWSAMQYVHHFGTERHVTRGARNLWIGQPLDLLWLNHNWHRTHHEHPTVPWIHLPAVGQGGQRSFLPWAWLRMFRGPRRATEHVENRFDGPVIA